MVRRTVRHAYGVGAVGRDLCLQRLGERLEITTPIAVQTVEPPRIHDPRDIQEPAVVERDERYAGVAGRGNLLLPPLRLEPALIEGPQDSHEAPSIDSSTKL